MQYDITLVTQERYHRPGVVDDYTGNILLEDRLVTEALKAQGLKVGRTFWDDPDFDWSATRFALIRATWDYFERIDEFRDWLATVESTTCLLNEASVVRWNLDKRYLGELEGRGVPIPETVFIPPGSRSSLRNTLGAALSSGRLKGPEYVLKPCISGGAWHTYRFREADIPRLTSVYESLIATEAWMIQDFQRFIVTEGELSLMVFGGRYSHAVIKKAKPGDFRVQDDHGGTVGRFEPGPEVVALAEHIVSVCPEPPVYARVDLFRRNDGQWALAELELIEPELWFRMDRVSALRFAEALKNKIAAYGMD